MHLQAAEARPRLTGCVPGPPPSTTPPWR